MQAPFHLLAFLVIGILLGAGYFALLFAAVAQLVSGSSSGRAIMTHLVRLAAAALMFWLIAQSGAAPLFASLVGFTLVLATLRPLTAS
jgi:N-ATPase, AtpR subunit